MAQITVAPSTEAMRAIVDRINIGVPYNLSRAAEYSESIIDPIEEITGLLVDVVCETEGQLEETLDAEDRTECWIRIYIRAKVQAIDPDTIDPLKLIVRQIWRQVNEYETSDGRVKVWKCDNDPKEVPVKAILQNHFLFVSTLLLRVEVEAS
jgi:hypothetical protein